MGKKEKLLQQMRQNPKNVRYEQLESILLSYGFEKREGKGSHVVFKLPGQRPLTVPRKKPFLKKIYVENALKAIDALIGNELE